MKPDPHPHLAGKAWIPGSGPEFSSTNPATEEPVWNGNAAAGPEVDAAVQAAARAFPDWSCTALETRVRLLQGFAVALEARSEEVSRTIWDEVGKPRWEALTEVAAMKGKIRFSIEAHRERRREVEVVSGSETSATCFRPHGVAAVLGPFNLPGHLPNAHIAPALLAGNCVVFKPSEQAPRTGRLLVELWLEAGLPPGVLNLVQGERATGELLVNHPGLNAIFFTGGHAAGRAIARARADTPEVILALEMGGNNPLLVWPPCEVKPAVYHALISAFLTSGQRCTCARRLIVPQNGFGDAFLHSLVTAARRLRPGPPSSQPEPFLGPVISPAAAERVLQARDALLQRGATEWLPMQRLSPSLLSPGIVDVTSVPDRPDEEVFGPLLQVIRVDSFTAAIREANATAFGLCAGLFCEDRDRWDQFYREVRAGIVNWNKPTTGASGALPFGGIGRSGNHRPSGFFAADYCSYPVASTEDTGLTLPASLAPGVDLSEDHG